MLSIKQPNLLSEKQWKPINISNPQFRRHLPSPLTRKATALATINAQCYSRHRKLGESIKAGPGLCERFVEFRKNYCPRSVPPLVLPTAPTDTEKDSYVNMKRPFLVTCGSATLLTLAVGAWMFAGASPIFSWYAVYVFISEFYLFTSLFITLFGKKFDLSVHRKVLEDNPLIDKSAPSVDIYLPVCKEPLEMLKNTWNHISAIQYPGRRSVFVLDDGADSSVRSLAQRFSFNYITRPDRPELKKAGNLRHAFAQTSGEFFAVFDADFCPRADFLLDTMPYLMADGSRAILQTPQFFRSAGNQTWTEQGAGAVQEYIFRIMQTCRDHWGAALCVGSNAVYRRAALEPIGGTFAIESSEDVYTGVYALTRGWTVKNIPLVLACGVCPDTPRAFFSQQMRWCSSMSLLKENMFWKEGLSIKQKLCYLIGFMYYPTTAIQGFLSPIPAPLILWTRPDLFKYYNLFFAFPSLIIGLLALRVWSRTRYTLSVQYVQMVMSYAHFQAIWDLLTGTKRSWIPSGGRTKAHKNDRYRNMRILACAWTLTHNIVLVAACAYRITGGMKWYNIVPALVIDGFDLLCIHRFLMYQHSKE